MDDPQNYINLPQNPDLIIPDPLRTPFAKPPPYGEAQDANQPPQPPGKSGKKIFKLIAIPLLVVIGIIGGYFAVNSYFPEYAQYVNPYLGPVLDPVLEQLQPVLDKIGLAKPSSPLPSPQPSPQGSPSPSPNLAGWQTYRNFEYGFEFKYPRDLVLDSSKKTDSQPIYMWISTKSGYGFQLDSRSAQKDGTPNTSVAEIPAYQYSTAGLDDAEMIHTSWVQGDLLYYFSILKDSQGKLDEISKNIYNQILSTFKFPPDADGDGLPDAEEPKYGANPNNPDTDGDTWPDGEEVQNGYNPLGTGRAK